MRIKLNAFLAALLAASLFLALIQPVVAEQKIVELVVNGSQTLVSNYTVTRSGMGYYYVFSLNVNNTLTVFIRFFNDSGEVVKIILREDGSAKFCYVNVHGSYICVDPPTRFSWLLNTDATFSVEMSWKSISVAVVLSNVWWMPDDFNPLLYGDKLTLEITLVSTVPVYVKAIVEGAFDTPIQPQPSEDFWSGVTKAFTGFFSALVGGIKAFVEMLQKVGEFIWNALRFLVESIKNIGTAFGAIVNGFSAIFEFFGSPGDPAKYQQLLVESISNQTLREALARCPNYDNKALCDYIENVKPEGLIGYISYMAFYASAAKNVLLWVVRNFFMVWTIVILAIVVFGMERSVKTKDPEHLTQSLQIAWQVFLFPFRVIWFFIELVIKLVQAIAQFIQAIKPI